MQDSSYPSRTPFVALFDPPYHMCSQEVYGDYYRGCGHFVKAYYSGEIQDCASQYCYNSSQHVHKAPNCPCPRAFNDNRRIQSMFHHICDACKTAAFDRLTRRG
ncbi:hypothetical protein LshimejAT787_0800550 [Lyophyllum shimeji]|uniref:Uncharacterized protein n=1 Tax=Lyophyllum shimeji TaxID=47721 RepID=A0A9P3PRG1_LYOSH|nr:hypothetical protein LshimejAT787_0800550 [Lyophyllum shimeji]